MTKAKMAEDKEQVQVIDVFDTPDAADRAYDMVLRTGYSPDEINVLMSAETQKQFKSGDPVAAEAAGTEVPHATEKVLGGAGAVSAVGMLSGIVAGIGVSILVPGLGLIVIGPLAALGAGLGAALGAMYGIAFSEMAGNKIADYEAKIREGKVLISVTPHSPEDRVTIQRTWNAISNNGSGVI